MRISSAILVTALGFTLAGCTSCGHSPTRVATNFLNNQSVIHTTPDSYPAKNPQQVAVYTNPSKPLTPYRVIGVATVSKHSLLGARREDATVHGMMKNIAASIGGDGLINVNNNADNMQASIIQFQRILI